MKEWTEADTWPRRPDETPDHHLTRLLTRVQNPFELPAALLRRLRTALAQHSALHSCHHSSDARRPLRRQTYRHEYLLPDGSSLTLWELVHNLGGDDHPQHEVYGEKSAVDHATARLRKADGTQAFPVEAADFDLEELAFSLLSAAPVEIPRAYVADHSADHARRVLRRAENADRPGDDTLRLLQSALAHEITQTTKRRCLADRGIAGFAVYEHAFLLLDGSEVSLWEVEHSLTPDGRPVCEVYLSEDAALDAMERRR